MTEIADDIADFLRKLAVFAAAVQRRLGWFLLLGLLASTVVAWWLFTVESAWWWNAIKCGLALLPILLWGFIWMLLNQLQEAPELAATLASRQDFSMINLRARLSDQKPGLWALFSTIREMRDSEVYESISDAVGSIVLLANPLFMIIAFAMLVILFLLVLVVPLALIF